jgi:hypothetical protein
MPMPPSNALRGGGERPRRLPGSEVGPMEEVQADQGEEGGYAPYPETHGAALGRVRRPESLPLSSRGSVMTPSSRGSP